jgi:restriction system protein
MPRQKNSPLEDLLGAVYHAPLWLGPIVAALIYVAGEIVGPRMVGSSALGLALTPTLKMLAAWLAVAVVVAAVLGAGERAIRKVRDGAIFDHQSGIESIRSLSWQSFERIVAEAYRRQGYEVQMTAVGADGGVDLILHKEGLRTDVQCKQWRTKIVGVELVRQLKGAMATVGVPEGIFVSSGRFTRDAQAFAQDAGIRTVDGPALERLVQGLQPKPKPTDALSRPDLRGCPRCGSTMVRKTAGRGQFAGRDFLGCSRYPACKGIRNLT